MESKPKNRKKWLFLGGGAAALAVVVITPLSYFLSKSNTENEFKVVTKTASNFWVKNNNLVLSLTQVLPNPSNSEVIVEYWENGNLNSKKSIKASVDGALNSVKAVIPDLQPGKDYSARVLDTNGNLLQEIKDFFVYSNPSFKAVSTTTEISFESTKIDPRLKDSDIYISYATASKEGDNRFRKEKAEVVPFKNNPNEYYIKAKMADLNPGTGYLVSISINNNEVPLMEQKEFFTAGENDLELSLLEVNTTTAKIKVASIQKFFNKFGREKDKFAFKYISSKDSKATSVDLTLPQNADEITLDLKDLNKGDLYQIYIFDKDSSDEEVLSTRLDFVTNIEPRLQKIFLDKEGHDFLPLRTQVIVSFTDFLNPYNHEQSIDPKTMQVVFWQGEANTKVTDALATAKTFELPNLVFGISSLFVSGLEHNKKYNFNLFEKSDKDYAKPQIATVNFTYQNVEMAATIENTEVTHNQATVKFTKLPADYKENELVAYLYDKKADGTFGDQPVKFKFISTIDKDNKTANVTFDNLEPLQSYGVAVFPNYSLVQNKQYNFLGESLTEFKTKGYLTFDFGTWYNAAAPTEFLSDANFTFELSKIDDSFPFGQDLTLQWRKKPEDPTTEWEEPNEKNSHNFKIENNTELANDAKSFSFVRNTKEFWLGEVNEVRLFNKDDSSKVNLIKKGNTEFKFNNSVTAEVLSVTTDTDFINNVLKEKFQRPKVDNIVNYDYLGGVQRYEPWQRYRNFNTKKKLVDLYEYLAFGNDGDADTQTFGNNIKNGFQNYMNTSDSQYGPTRIYIFSPLDISDYPGDDLIEKHANLIREGDVANDSPAKKRIEIGGVGPNFFSSANPVKPSSFMGSGWKFKDWEAVVQGFKFRIQRFKETGVSLDNLYLKWDYKKELSQIVPAFFKTKKDYLTKILQLNYGAEFNIYNLSVNSEDDILPNDATGELGLKVQATPKTSGTGTEFSFYIVLKGLKKSNPEIISQDINFSLYPDQAIGNYRFVKEFTESADENAKKTLIETYFKVLKDSNVDFKPKGAGIAYDQLVLNLEITKTLYKWGVPGEPKKANVQVTVPLNDLNNLPFLSKGFPNGNSYTQDNQGVTMEKSGITGFDTAPTKNGKGYALNLTYPDFLALMKEAVAKDAANSESNDAEVKKIANQIINNPTDFPIGNLKELGFLFFSPMGTTPLKPVTNGGSGSTSVDKTTTKGFYAPVSEGIEGTIADLEKVLVDMVKNYGK
ncbi:hypothetical protein ACW95P_00100 [Candidatus Mycoplasma pogonae]